MTRRRAKKVLTHMGRLDYTDEQMARAVCRFTADGRARYPAILEGFQWARRLVALRPWRSWCESNIPKTTGNGKEK